THSSKLGSSRPNTELIQWGQVAVAGGAGVHMRHEEPGAKKQHDKLRRDMLTEGRTYEEIAAEFALRWGFRPRQAWRHAYGWTQEQVADLYNQQLDNGQAPMTGKRISDYENWPYSGKKPTNKTFFMLAKIYSTNLSKLIDHDDRRKMNADELVAFESPKDRSL